jgi:hypothetical protein
MIIESARSKLIDFGREYEIRPRQTEKTCNSPHSRKVKAVEIPDSGLFFNNSWSSKTLYDSIKGIG